MTVSAIIPCYNAEATITRAVESVLQQTAEIGEIIVVNDGSTDGSLAVLQKLKHTHRELVIIDQKNAGVSSARNTAIAMAKGAFILVLDADDYFEPTFVEKALKKFQDNDSYGAVMCGYVRVVNDKKILPYIPVAITLQSCLLHNGALSCLIFKKEAIVKAGGYDTSFKKGYEDWDLNIRILKNGYHYGIVNEILFNYTDTLDSRTYTANENDLALKLKIYEKYESDYREHGKYIYEQLHRKCNILLKDKQKIVDTTSFKLGHSITSIVSRIITPVKNLISKR
ncbi:glycosyltransferase family 2 protein [Dokdonia sinensis]|uniref:Glycosyltransferase family 2 protein n=1 Tax=Dokdonia sinensis TaxID=2479847 RepID=A0A3M0FXF9_9FLAO|nr:glycosyltransferase family A protein [Dokdonia sinensis]RMB57430.1 glycosyltransferase family 2 protein [Dokdonia sinensis]